MAPLQPSAGAALFPVQFTVPAKSPPAIAGGSNGRFGGPVIAVTPVLLVAIVG
jgi:hypothetical protein